MLLVLSLFPGIDLLGRAFELEGFSVVRGPDPALGTGDIRQFKAPARFDGVIGGSPCQDFSLARRCPPTGYGLEMIQEFRRLVTEVAPAWFLLENVPTVPDVKIPGFSHQRIDLKATEFGLAQNRLRHFQFGSRFSFPLIVPRGRAIKATEPCCVASEGSKKGKRTWEQFCSLMGLPPDFSLPYFTLAARYRAVGNGVPLPMGRAIAMAISSLGRLAPTLRPCVCGCGRPVTGRRAAATPGCRKRMERRRRVTN